MTTPVGRGSVPAIPALPGASNSGSHARPRDRFFSVLRICPSKVDEARKAPPPMIPASVPTSIIREMKPDIGPGDFGAFGTSRRFFLGAYCLHAKLIRIKTERLASDV